jgi:hypothetical protein
MLFPSVDDDDDDDDIAAMIFVVPLRERSSFILWNEVI